ncbi:Hypothetical_protein [Hexamita inflata]|uniref:Hypothetical_protein n=1 Tax=Hexamita inflata TaxID=28002 RepID=A0AA86PIB5_9EUKA|nr:Hypothetical protein HINF_LOCUS26683 [Hexamita inflata]
MHMIIFMFRTHTYEILTRSFFFISTLLTQSLAQLPNLTFVMSLLSAEFDRTFGCGNEFQQSQCYICYIRRFLTHFQTTIVYYYTKFIEFIVIKTNILKLLQKIK